MAHEFEELALDGYNYPTWALDVKISLAFRGILHALSFPEERETAFLDTYKYQALFIIRNHLHPTWSRNMWWRRSLIVFGWHFKAIMNRRMQFYYRTPIMSGLRFVCRIKSIEDNNHAIHKVYAKLRFYENEPLEEDKIEKTLQTMLPSDRVLQYQYWAHNYQRYADLIRDLLHAEKYDELTIKNHHQHRVGAAPLPKIHHNEKKASFSMDNNPKKNGRSARHQHNRHKNMQLSKTIKKDGTSFKGNNV
jgi:hypothetical protein